MPSMFDPTRTNECPKCATCPFRVGQTGTDAVYGGVTEARLRSIYAAQADDDKVT